MQEPKAIVLIVDDNPTNLSVLFEALQQANYRVLIAQDGQSALERLQYIQPDIILLDIMMPGIDGFETLQRIKAEPAHSAIPVIFMTALHETSNEVKGLKHGAVDYITKPLSVERVLARLNTHLTLRNLQKELQEHNAELEAYAHTVAHDLKGPLSLMFGYIELLTEEINKMGSEKSRTSLQKLQDSITKGSEKSRASLQKLQDSITKQTSIVEELLLLSSIRKESLSLTPLNMEVIVLQAQSRLTGMIQKYQAEIIMPSHFPTALGQAGWVEEIWVNYISNGLKYGGKPPYLTLGATPQPGGFARFWVQDNGFGLTPDAQANLFVEYSRLHKTRAQGHGLGLSIVKRIAQRLGGEAGVESKVGQGSTFYFTLPMTQ